MSKYLDIQEEMIGKRIGKLIVRKQAKWKEHPPGLAWVCECDCGNIIYLNKAAIDNAEIESCGCSSPVSERYAAFVNKEYEKSSYEKRDRRLYWSWLDMIHRCYRDSHKSYRAYGGRGITVCNEWRNSYKTFKEWAMSNGYRNDLTIDRIDNNGNYCPENCRWATKREQTHNMANVRLLYWEGKEYTPSELGGLLHVTPKSIVERIKKGMSLKEAVNDAMMHRIKPWDLERARMMQSDRDKKKRAEARLAKAQAPAIPLQK